MPQLPTILELLQEYGPLVGILLAIIIWQAWWIRKLIDRHQEIYEAEIKRMSKRERMLLSHILETPSSSEEVPTMTELHDAAAQMDLELEDDGSSDSPDNEEPS